MAIKNKRLKLLRGSTYTFDVSDSALANNPLKFTADSGTTEYTDGITLSGANAQGLTGATLTFTVPASAPNNLNYYGGDDGNIDDGSANISNYTYDNVTFDTGTANINNMHWKPDGTKVYILTQASAGEVLEINLSTPWDLSTATDSGSPWSGFISQASLGGYGLHASTDGTKFYIMNFNNDVIYQYTLSTPWDISTASYANKSYDFGSSGYNTFEFNPTGTKIYVHDGSDDVIETHTLSTPWDISTASYDGAGSNFDHTVGTTIDQTLGITFSPDGTSFFVIAYMPVAIQGNIYQWDLTTPYDLSTASLTSNTLNVQNEVVDPIDIQFSSDGTKLYFVNRTNDAIYQYSIPSSGGASLKMGNHVFIPGSAPGAPASGDYTDSALSQSFFLDAIKAYGDDIGVNTYSPYSTNLSGDFNDPEALATNGKYTLLSDANLAINHSGPGSTGNTIIAGSGGWTWLIRNRDGALMKSWNGLVKDYDHNLLDLETYYIGTSPPVPLYSKYHTCNWGKQVAMNDNFMFIGCAYRPTGGSNTSLNWSDDRAFIFVYDIEPPFNLRKVWKLEDFASTSFPHSSSVGYSGGGSGYLEQNFTLTNDELFVPASYSYYNNTSTVGGRVGFWDISDPDPANWSTAPDAVINNPINVVSTPIYNNWNNSGNNYANYNFGQNGVAYGHNRMVVGHGVYMHTYTRNGNSFTHNSSVVVGPYRTYSYKPYAEFTNDSANPRLINFGYGTAGSSTTREIRLLDPSNGLSADWTVDLNAHEPATVGYPWSARLLTVGKDVKVELFSYGDAYKNNKAGHIRFLKLSDQSEVLDLDNPFLRDSDGLYFGDNYDIKPIDSAGSNRYSLVAWGEPDDVNTKDIASFWELVWDSDNAILKLEDPVLPPISFGTDPGAIKFDTELDFSNNANNPAMPKSPVWNNDGTKLFYLAGGAFSNTMQVFQMSLSTPYEISSIDSSTSGSILDLNTDSDFHNIFTDGTDENNPQYLWFKPDGTKMYIAGNSYDTVIQYSLDTPWDIMGGRTADHKIGTGYLANWSNSTMQNGWTFNSQLEIGNWGSHEWIKDGYSLVSSWSNDRGASIEQTFSTPYDLSSVTSNFTASNIVDHTHTLYIDSDGDGALWSQRVRKLGSASGGQFNHDGTERYFLQGVWMDSAFDDPNIGNGNATMRVSLVKATLSTPYDITTMDYHSQTELTNLPGGLHSTRPNGTLSFSPDGRKLYFMSSSDNIGGSDVYDRARLFQFSSTGDSAGSVFIREPDISVKPYIQYVAPGFAWGGNRGVFGAAGSSGGTRTKNIEYWAMSTGGTAQTFGNLTMFSREMSGAMSNNTRVVFGSRETGSSSTVQQLSPTMDYITPATLGDAVDFGDDIASYYGNSAMTSNGTTGLMIAGNLPTGNPYPNNYSDYMKSIRKITIDTTGNATDMGDISKKLYAVAGAGDATRALHAGGVDRTNFNTGSATSTNEIKYINYATPSSSYDFGDLNGMGGSQWDHVGGTSDATRSIFAGGYVRTNYYNVQQTAYAASANVIHYVTTQTTSNASDFGDMTYWSYKSGGGCTDGTTAQFAGGTGKLTTSPYSAVDIIEKVTIQTTGNATNFGTITQANSGSNGAGA